MVLDNSLEFFQFRKNANWTNRNTFFVEKMPTGLTAIPSLTYLIVKKVSPILITPE
jgi:hypothetical protein